MPNNGVGHFGTTVPEAVENFDWSSFGVKTYDILL